MEPTTISRSDGGSFEFVDSGKANMSAVIFTNAEGQLFMSVKDVNQDELEELKADFLKGSNFSNSSLLKLVSSKRNWIAILILTVFVLYCLVRANFDPVLCILILPVYGYLAYWGLRRPRK